MGERIVVGVDDARDSREAVAWAVREARLRQAELVAVHAWVPSWAEGFNTQWADDREVLEKQAADLVQGILDEVQAEDPDPVAARIEVEVGSAARLLVAASVTADLVVVGTRGRPGLALGSVSTSVVHHARCPVVVVPPDRGER